jgi:ubiquinone/menaquinone biosynthesis C-methylase UbiE
VRARWTQLAELFCRTSEVSAEWSRGSEDLLLAQLERHRCRDILDLACGVGDPSLRLAARFPDARVVAVDFVDEMLLEVQRRAAASGLRNVRVQTADMLALPFAAGSFDTVTCRFGIQYYDDEVKRRILAEAARVLSPRGVIAVVDWGVQGHGLLKDFYMSVLSQYPETAHANDAATAFNLIDDLAFAHLLREADFNDVKHDYPEVRWRWSGSPKSLWQHVTVLAPQLTEILSRIAPALADEIDGRIVDGLARFVRGSSVIIPVRNVALSGVRN